MPVASAVKHVGVVALSMVVLVGCGRGALEDPDEIAQSAGDALASLDELTGEGAFAFRLPHRPALERPGVLDVLGETLLGSAYAARCNITNTFGACSGGVRTKGFGGCTLGALSFEGDVTLTFSDSACSMAGDGASVTRTADFSITGRREATLAVTSPGGGQTLTRTGASAFTWKVGGMNRVMTGSDGRKLVDVSTRTLADITVSGTGRSGRVVDGGKLEIKHNLAGYTTELIPENITWANTCNCPVSGKLTGTVSGATARSFSVEMTACGKATVTANGSTQSVELDRCIPST